MEFQHGNPEEKSKMRDYMESQDYVVITEISVGQSANDFMFIKKSLSHLLDGVDMRSAKKLPPWMVDWINVNAVLQRRKARGMISKTS